MANQFDFSLNERFLQGYAHYLKQIREANPGRAYKVTLSVELISTGTGYEVAGPPQIQIEEDKEEQPTTSESVTIRKAKASPTATIWATTTDLEGTDQERKRYFTIFEDGEKSARTIVVVGPGPALSIEPYQTSDYGYDDFDQEDEDEDEDYYPEEGEDAYEA